MSLKKCSDSLYVSCETIARAFFKLSNLNDSFLRFSVLCYLAVFLDQAIIEAVVSLKCWE